MATLSIVATPIGNLEDITLRALTTLRLVDFVLCEDTRVTKRLLERHGLSGKQLLPYNGQKSGVSIKKVIDLLEKGQDIALVTDAGTPGISDPGAFLVSKVREHFRDEVAIVSIPGPSALTAALSIAGVPSDAFLFLGFLPHKKGRETLFKEIAGQSRTVVFYESPHRILKTLASLSGALSQDKKVVVLRELTKMHESVVSGSPSEVESYFKDNPDRVRGEFVVVVA